MKNVGHGALATAFALLTVGSAHGATHYVSPSGADENPCTPAQPCREISRALQLVAAGDVVQVENGSYQGFSVLSLVGTSGFPITIVAPGGMADITADADDTIFVQLSSHVVLDGLRVSGAGRHAVRISQSNDITVRNGVFTGSGTVVPGNGINVSRSHDIVLEDNECAGSLQLRHGIAIENSSDRPVVRRNRLHDNTGDGIHMNADLSFGDGDGIISNALVEGNLIYTNNLADVGAAGIKMDGVADAIIRNNVFYDNRGTGITAFKSDGAVGPQGLQILNNTIDMPANGRNGMSLRHATGPSTLRNNIVIVRDPSRVAIRFGKTSDVELIGANSNYNVLDRLENETVAAYTLASWQATFGYEPNSLSAAPGSLWVNAGAADYHLSPSSPAVDAGQTQALVPTDIEGVARPQAGAWDIGAYERVVASFSVNDVSVLEGPGGTVNAAFTVSLSAALPATATVAWATSDGTALAPGDYTAASGTASFTAGQLSKTVTVAVNGDIDDELDETFLVTLSNPTLATISDGQGVGTIQDDDPNADVSITKTDGVDTASPNQVLTYTITAANAGPNDVTAVVTDNLPAGLTNATWTCAPSGGASCVPVGAGNINESVGLPVGGSVVFSLTATVAANPASVRNTATITIPGNFGDPNPANNSATDDDLLLCDAYTLIVPDGRAQVHSLADGATAWFVVALRDGASYSLEAANALAVAGAPSVTIFNGADGCSGSSSVDEHETVGTDPQAGASSRFSFTAGGADTLYRIRVVNGSGADLSYTLGIGETTMFSAAWSTGSTFETYYSFQNTTNATVTGLLTLRDAAGLVVGNRPLNIPPGQTAVANTSAGSMAIVRNRTGTAQFRHDGPPGAVNAGVSIANFGFAPPYVQIVKFQALRDLR